MIRYKLYVIFFLLIFICSFGFVSATNNDLSLLGKVIYIDPGHGGLDPGATYKDIYEKDINLQISLKLSNILEQNGAIVLLTRDGDYDLSASDAINRKRSDLSNRANVINNSNCDIYISIHLNSISSSVWNGAQVFYDDVNSNNALFAKIMQESLKKELNTTREYKKMTDMYMYKRIRVPGILIEVGFLSNANERYLLQQSIYQDKIANTIYMGVYKYFQQ